MTRDYEWDALYYEALREVDELCPGSEPIAPRRATSTELAMSQLQANAAGVASLEMARAQQNSGLLGASAAMQGYAAGLWGRN